MTIEQFKKKKLPSHPGVYMFMSGQKILYIGRATSLKERVKSYFAKDILNTRGPIILTMVKKATGLKTISTDSVLEALLLEAHLIKTHQPAYNSKEKDNKSFNYIVITKEDFPRVLLVRGRQLEGEEKYLFLFGPFIHGSLLKDALKIVRKIFPFRDKCLPASESKYSKACFNHQLGLCPGVCSGEVSKIEYQKHIQKLALFLKGKRKTLISSLKKEMKTFASRQEFEKAGEIKRTLFSLEHIQDVSLIKNARDMAQGGPKENVRIEGYDIAHIAGTSTVGVMTVIVNGEPDTSQYRKFKIKTVTGSDDIKALSELVTRRLKHSEWPFPQLIVADGGLAQLHAVEHMLKQNNLSIPVVSVVKDERHKPRDFYGDAMYISKYKKEILLVNNEAHRFALAYHRELRSRLRGN